MILAVMRVNWVIAWEKSGKLRPRPSCSKGGYTSTIRCITQLISRALICWIEIYPMDIPIHPMNNWSVNGTRTLASAMPMRCFTSWSIRQTSICLIMILVAQFYHVITQLHMTSPACGKKKATETLFWDCFTQLWYPKLSAWTTFLFSSEGESSGTEKEYMKSSLKSFKLLLTLPWPFWKTEI